MSDRSTDAGSDVAISVALSANFEHIRKFRDHGRDLMVAQILPGEYYVTNIDEMISTVLGSCISVCVRDPQKRIGGMNHFMLPTGNRNDDQLATRYGLFAMEALINDILQFGGSRSDLEVKVFGGGKISPNMVDIGSKNIAFTREYLSDEGMAIISEDVGLIYPRKVNYSAKTGKVMVKRLRSLHTRSVADQEDQYSAGISFDTSDDGDVELFG